MTNDNELDPVARLRAADPASEVVPRAGYADELLARTLGPGSSAESASVTDLTAERVRRRPRWIAIAAVAASVAIVGAAGFGLGVTAGGTNLAGGTSAPPISLQTGGSPGGIAEDGSEPAVGGGVDSQVRSDSTYPYGSGRNHFSASGLSTSDGTAPAYAFDPSVSLSAATVTALATALGIASPPEQTDGAWIAGPQDGSAPSLWVYPDGVLSFSYQDPQNNPWLCAKTGENCDQVGEAPSEETAIGALRALIVAAGRDPGTFEFTSHMWEEDSPVRTAEARLVVDGQSIDRAWSMDVAEAGVVNVNGVLADVVGLGDYPVVSQREGFERLSDPRFGAVMAILPYVIEAQVSASGEPLAPGTPPTTPSPGTSIPWPVNDIEIVSARLGLASQWQPDGSVLVVPAYEFTDADGQTWSVIAVADSKLDFDSE